MKQITLLSFNLFFLSSFLIGQADLNQQLDQLLDQQPSYEAGGRAVLISENGNPLYQHFAGFTNLKKDKPINSSTIFAIGSISKQFTAAAILLLQEQEKLNVNDFIGSYLEAFSEEDFPIKIEHLLSHTSGLPSDNDTQLIQKGFQTYISPQEIAAILSQESLLFSPGSQYDYSNNGYILLGLIIEKVSGESYADFLKKNLFQKAKMLHTQLISSRGAHGKVAPGFAEAENGNYTKMPLRASSFSAGGILSTANDLNKWIEALFGCRILNQKSLDQMLTPYTLASAEKLSTAFGWEINSIQGIKTYEHSGFEPGYKSNLIYSPHTKMMIIVLQNTEQSSPVPISILLAATTLGKPYPSTQDYQAYTLSEKQKYVGVYQFDLGTERIIGLDENDQLYYKAKGGLTQPLFVLENRSLCFTNSYRQLHFGQENRQGFQVISYQNRAYQIEGKKISTDVPSLNQSVEIDLDRLARYAGTYQADEFQMKIFMDKDQLWAQPSGSDALPLEPKGSNQFFIKEIGAEITFILKPGTKSTFETIQIILEGQLMEAKRK